MGIEISKSKNASLVGLKGKIIDETKNTFLVKTDKGEKRILKKGSTFVIDKKETEGQELVKRPEERIK